MNVLLAGSTGAIGQSLVRALNTAGHKVIALTRNPDNVARLAAAGTEPVVASVMDRDGLLRAVDGLTADAVLHEATALRNVSPRAKLDGDPTNALREQGTANLLDAARVVGAGRFVTQSLILGYGYVDHGPGFLTEKDPFGQLRGGFTDPVVAATRSTEQQTFSAEGIDGVALRYGVFYGPDTFSSLFANLLRKRAFALPRGGDRTMSWVHVDDAAAATVAALERGRPGQAYNVTDDEPVTWKAFVHALAKRYRTPHPWMVPTWVLRLGVPYLAALMADTSIRVDSTKAKRELGWTPAFPTYLDGIPTLPDLR